MHWHEAITLSRTQLWHASIPLPAKCTLIVRSFLPAQQTELSCFCFVFWSDHRHPKGGGIKHSGRCQCSLGYMMRVPVLCSLYISTKRRKMKRETQWPKVKDNSCMHVMLPCLPSLSRFEFKEPWESGMGLNKLHVKKKIGRSGVMKWCTRTCTVPMLGRHFHTPSSFWEDYAHLWFLVNLPQWVLRKRRINASRLFVWLECIKD